MAAALLYVFTASFEFRFDVRIGTRPSPLALAQADLVAARLFIAAPGTLTSIVPLESKADQSLEKPMAQVDFTSELDAGVIDRRLDLAVHSLKDLPPEHRWTEHLTVACHLQRASPNDVIVGVPSLDALPQGARVGTASVRRRAQLSACRPDLEIVNVRGTVAARLARLDDGDVDALVLARAGLDRLAVEGLTVCELPPDVMLPGPGQGIVCAVCRRDGDALRLLRAADDADAHVAAAAERAVLNVLDEASSGMDGRPPIGALMARDGEGRSTWTLRALLAARDGSSVVHVTRVAPCECSVADAVALGRAAGEELLSSAAAHVHCAGPSRPDDGNVGRGGRGALDQNVPRYV